MAMHMLNHPIGLLLLFIAPSCVGLPHFLLRNKAAKCIKVDAVPARTTLRIGYVAPDLLIMPAEEVIAQPSSEIVPDPKDGLDSRYNEREKRRLDMLKQSQMKDISIMIIQQVDPLKGIVRASEQRALMESQEFTNKIQQFIEQKEGYIDYTTGGEDVNVQICAQSYVASSEDPSRIAFNITFKTDDLFPTRSGAIDEEKVHEWNRIIKDQTSEITQELIRIAKQVGTVMKQINYGSAQEVEFQAHSIALSRAVRFWPIFRMSVLVIGGYLQVSHVLGYMKRRHIY